MGIFKRKKRKPEPVSKNCEKCGKALQADGYCKCLKCSSTYCQECLAPSWEDKGQLECPKCGGPCGILTRF